MNDSTASAAPGSDQPNQDQPPQDQPSGAGKRPSSVDQLAEISRLLRGDPDQVDGQEQQPPKPRDDGKPPTFKSLDDVAKALKIDVAQLYDLEVPLRGDAKERKKLGELKDYFAGQDDHRLDRISWEEQRSQQQAELARSRLEIAELLKAFPPDKLNSQVLDAARKRQDAYVTGERKKTLDRIPEWKDDDRRAVEIAGIVEHLRDFGLPAETLQGIHDHRMLAYMRDNWLRMTRLKAALEKVQAVRPATPPRSKPAGKGPSSTPVRPSAGPAGTAAQVAAISKLLRG